MDFTLFNKPSTIQQFDCIAIPVFDKRKLPNIFSNAPYLQQLIANCNFDGKIGQTLLIPLLPSSLLPGTNDLLSSLGLSSSNSSAKAKTDIKTTIKTDTKANANTKTKTAARACQKILLVGCGAEESALNDSSVDLVSESSRQQRNSLKGEKSIPKAFQVATRRTVQMSSGAYSQYVSSESSRQQRNSLNGEGYISDKTFISVIKTMANALANTNITTVGCFLTELNVKDRDAIWKIQHTVITIQDALYCFNTYKSKKISRYQLKKIALAINCGTADESYSINNKVVKQTKTTSKKLLAANSISSLNQALRSGIAIAKGMHYTKDLANTPANICTPNYLAKEASKISKKYNHLSCSILERKDMLKLGMGALLAVAQGSIEPPKLIILKYDGSKYLPKTKQKSTTVNAPIALVGKGITFDTGGNSLKPPTGMIGMKYDMSGAATVLGTILFAAETKLPINLIGIMACAENMPGGSAIRPDDIVTSMAGITIEIANTDAEGRLVLCDALTYCQRFKPKAVIDIATLTGACVVALGRHYAGLFSNDAELAKELTLAGNITGDKCWQLPIGEEYQCQLDSPHADVVNVGGPEAGSITAACFLARFTSKLKWAHLDVAGTATGKDKVATGRPVPLLAQYLLSQVSQ